MKLPIIKSLSQKLQFTCLAMISSYLIFIIAYTHTSAEPLKHLIISDMLHSALLATVISLAGGLLLDCEIRLCENKHKP